MDQAVQTRVAGRDGAGPPRVPIAFHFTGRRCADELDAIDQLGLRPALFAGYHNLTTLRYDFPLVFIRKGGYLTDVESLSGLFDAAMKQFSDTPDDERVRWYGLRVEQEIRALAAGAAASSFSDLWMQAASRLPQPDGERFRAGVRRLRCALPADGETVDCDLAMPSRLCRHVWEEAQDRKARRFRDSARRLVIRLSEILRADFDRSERGLSAERLKASVGTPHRDAIDFEQMSHLLRGASNSASLSPGRRQRIEWLLFVLTAQRFFPITDETGDAATAPYGFVFETCSEAIAAYRERLPALVELAKALAMAELEVGGQYKESKHDDFFADFGADDLDEADFDLFPDYLIRARAQDRSLAESETLLDAFPTGLRAKLLVQFDDILVPSPELRGQAVFDGRSKQLASAAIGLGAFYVLQASASSLFRLREQLRRGMTYAGPALFIVFSGAPGTVGDLPPYLVAAAATESRAFPSLAYDPSAGADWASRFQLLDNPQPERDWPTHTLSFADEAHQRISEDLAFTPVDFVACDRRHARHFALMPRARWNDSLAPLAAFLAGGRKLSDKVPYVTMVDQRQVLHKVIVDDKLVREARRCSESWQSLQELGGIHNSHAERLVAEERKLWAESQRPTPSGANGRDPTEASIAPAAAPAAVAAPAPSATESDEPYIETPRCTTCNECTQINAKMFAYDANKQAFIANPDAGTYRQLVEAAESCQVAIIHPGKPRNPDEPGLDELRKRAEPFL